MQKFSFQDFIAIVGEDSTQFMTELHHQLTEKGCTIEVKEAKSGYLVSYLSHKKTVANIVFRKKGMFVRIYANHIIDYMEWLDTLPKAMIKSIKDAPVCKRLLNPDACNSKCAMGYDFILQGERQQKCRNGAFMFMFCAENNPFIETFIKKELEARSIG